MILYDVDKLYRSTQGGIKVELGLGLNKGRDTIRVRVS